MENKLSVEEIKQAFINSGGLRLSDKIELACSNDLQSIGIIKRIAQEQMLEQERVTRLTEAMKVVCEVLKDDSSYYIAWQANIAMAFKDEFTSINPDYKSTSDYELHIIANEAAKNFLNLLIK